MPLISLDGLLTFWDKSRLDKDSHIMLTLQGRFKGELDKRWHLVPISNATRSGLPFRNGWNRCCIVGSTCMDKRLAGCSRIGEVQG